MKTHHRITVALALLTAAAPAHTIDQILLAIRYVETGSHPRQGDSVRGDGGRARGPFQIHESYCRDSGVPGRYQDCDHLDYSRRVVLAYWQRHCPDALRSRDAQTLARVHNGGPAGPRLHSTERYWQAVKQVLSHTRTCR
jgi:hypothetical protein